MCTTRVGKLEASEWTRPDGSRALYRSGQNVRGESTLKALPADSNEMWRLRSASARDFLGRCRGRHSCEGRSASKTFVISYVVPNGVSSSGLVQAALTLSKVGTSALSNRVSWSSTELKARVCIRVRAASNA